MDHRFYTEKTTQIFNPQMFIEGRAYFVTDTTRVNEYGYNGEYMLLKLYGEDRLMFIRLDDNTTTGVDAVYIFLGQNDEDYIIERVFKE